MERSFTQAISSAIASLVERGLIEVRDKADNLLPTQVERRGKKRLLYACTFIHKKKLPRTCVQNTLANGKKLRITKETPSKEILTKVKKFRQDLQSVGGSFEQLMLDKGIMTMGQHYPIIRAGRIPDYEYWKKIARLAENLD